MIDFKEIPHDNDTWELFARDFLSELGFIIESPPDRGADGGKDMLILEEVKGKLHSYQFRWLVSCKHFAHSGNSVNESNDEKNILERIKGFNADGFIGFYSTLPSSGLNNRLSQLKKNREIQDYKIFDNKLIESYLLGLGFSRIMVRYLPNTYKIVRPLHSVIDQYIPLQCDNCGKDLLETIDMRINKAIFAVATQRDEDGILHMLDCYFSCNGECDQILKQEYMELYNAHTKWKNLSDSAMPNEFLRNIMVVINQLHDKNEYFYHEKALEKVKVLFLALSQKIFREVTEEEKDRLNSILERKVL